MGDAPSAADVLALHAASRPDATALIDDRAEGPTLGLTFAELNAEVNRLVHLLRAQGIGSGDKVAWCGMNSIGVVRVVHAARKLGATAVPVNYRLSPDEMVYVLNHCDAVFAYVDTEFAERFARIRPRLEKLRDVAVFDGPPGPGMLDADGLLAAASDAEPPAADAEPATMIYTSGTTGAPKGALRRGLGNRDQVLALIAHIGYEPDDVFLTTGPLYHSGPLGFMQIAHNLGHTVVLQRRFHAEDWLRLVHAHRVTSSFAAPTPIRLVCHLPAGAKARYDVGSMRRMVANAAPWSFALKQAYLAYFPEDSLWEVYGSTELGVNTVLAPVDQRRKPGSCGRPAPGVDLALFDEKGREIREPHVPGELYARSRTVFDTYYKEHDRYEEERRGDFHTVGDVAYFDEEGFFFICDRKKDMIISGGMNVYPAEIEAALERHPDVLDVAVFGIPSEEWGESVHAVVVPRAPEQLTPEDVVAFAREHLAGYKVPRSVAFAAEIPRTGSGKILKRVLREPFWRGRERRI